MNSFAPFCNVNNLYHQFIPLMPWNKINWKLMFTALLSVCSTMIDRLKVLESEHSQIKKFKRKFQYLQMLRSICI